MHLIALNHHANIFGEPLWQKHQLGKGRKVNQNLEVSIQRESHLTAEKIQALSTELYKRASEDQAKMQGKAGKAGHANHSHPAGEDEGEYEGGESQSGPAAGNDDVVDAEFEEVKDDDKGKKKK